MLQMQIPKEINDIETKIIGPFTLRQTICGGLGIFAIYNIHRFVGPIVGGDQVILFDILTALPFAAVGFIPTSMLQGMHFEEYVAKILFTMFLAPAKRKYKTDNTKQVYFDVQEEEIEAERINAEKNMTKAQKRAAKKFRRSVKDIK